MSDEVTTTFVGDVTELSASMQRIKSEIASLSQYADMHVVKLKTAADETGAIQGINAISAKVKAVATEHEGAWRGMMQRLGITPATMTRIGMVGVGVGIADTIVKAAGVYGVNIDQQTRRFAGLGATGRGFAESIAGQATLDASTKWLQSIPVLGTAVASAFERLRNTTEYLAQSFVAARAENISNLIQLRQSRGEFSAAMDTQQSEKMREARTREEQTGKEVQKFLAGRTKAEMQRLGGRDQDFINETVLDVEYRIPVTADVLKDRNYQNARAAYEKARQARLSLQASQRVEMEKAGLSWGAQMYTLSTRGVSAEYSQASSEAIMRNDPQTQKLADMAQARAAREAQWQAELSTLAKDDKRRSFVEARQREERAAFEGQQRAELFTYAANPPMARVSRLSQGAAPYTIQTAELQRRLNDMVSQILEAVKDLNKKAPPFTDN